MWVMTNKLQLVLSVAKDYSRTPGPRTDLEGHFSGEAFLELLDRRFQDACSQQTTLLVDLDGAAGYAPSFLEAAFGGLARRHEIAVVQQTVKVKSDDEPDLIPEIEQYIREARD